VKILYICCDLGVEISGRKGASTHVREACHALQRYGHEVLLVSPVVGDRSKLGFPVVEVTPPRARWLGADLRYVVLNYQMQRLLPKIIQDFAPDVVYERYSLYQTAGQAICRKLGIPRILEVNTLLATELRHRLRFPRLARLIESRLWRGESAIICVSSVLRDMIVKQSGLDMGRMAGIVVSPVGVDPDVFAPTVSPLPRSKVGCERHVIVGYVGTLTTWHGVELFFKVGRLLQDENLPICLVVVGGEPERVERLRQRAATECLEHLHFAGSVPHEEVPHWLATMDICLIADTQDWSSPTKYFEMAAMGKPVVAARVAAIEEVMGGDGVGGVLFERGNAQDAVSKLRLLVEHPEQAKTLGQQARERVLENYSWERNLERMMALYRKLGVSKAELWAGNSQASSRRTC
jgi:glycosyltransferase involved in cell wall biosynthesis